MFSGIKSMIFGYSEPGNSTASGNNNESTNPLNDSTSSIILKNDTSALIEQTLNAATTKFTEKLLPQSPSIEQLQSSSHQLLPTLNEQHEEDEFKRKKQVQSIEIPKPVMENDEDDDDDCFNADSWELLDFVEEPKASTSKGLSLTIQDNSIVNNKTQWNGILKQNFNNKPSFASIVQANQSTQRQKPKVSFETPDLVINKQEIELAPASKDTTKAASQGSSGSSVNDSSDIAEMDESWFVTPPPCFTGANKLNKIKRPKAKESDRENALIEHPSIYIDNKFLPENKELVTIVNRRIRRTTSNSSNSDMDSKRKPLVQQQQASTSKAGSKVWENKFIVTNWNYDEQDDLNDFDNMFEADELSYSSPKIKKSKIKNKQRKRQSFAKRTELTESIIELAPDYESDCSISTPPLVGTTTDCTGKSSSLEVIDMSASSSPISSASSSPISDENSTESLSGPKRQRNKSKSERKAPIPVRSIEPERQPGWQLRKKRSKRKPLVTAIPNTCQTADGKHHNKPKLAPTSSDQPMSSESGRSSSMSARSTPTLIDRIIGSSIVANLTGAFPAGSIQTRATLEEANKLNQSVLRKSSTECNLIDRRRLSKGYLNRQNDCAKQANSNRRADRRLKMYAKPNGYSINRKVHTSIH